MFEHKRTEIDHHTIKLIIGVVAISLPIFTSLLSSGQITSISASYHNDGWSRNIFIGFLFVIFSLLLSYNGRSNLEMILSKCASFCAVGVALFPCSCGGHDEIIPYVHYISATVLFLILVLFCISFYKRARSKGHLRARIRAFIYAACGIIIVVSIAVMGLDFILEGAISSKVSRLIFYGETAGLVVFGVAWLTASRMIPIITTKEERIPILPLKSK